MFKYQSGARPLTLTSNCLCCYIMHLHQISLANNVTTRSEGKTLAALIVGAVLLDVYWDGFSIGLRFEIPIRIYGKIHVVG